MSSPSPPPSVPLSFPNVSLNNDSTRDSSNDDLLWSTSLRKRVEDDLYVSGSSLLGQLHRRQYDMGRHPPSKAWFRSRRISQRILPNLTVADVKRRFIFPRRFSPDGRYLIAFNTSQVLVYEFLGTGQLCALVHEHFSRKPGHNGGRNALNQPYSVLGNDYWLRASSLSSLPGHCGAFDSCFRQVACVDVGLPAESLSRDVALFSASEGGRYLIVASVYPGVFFDEDLSPPTSVEQRQTSESLPLRNPSALQHVTLHIIDILGGVITDSITFRCDIISLSSANPGVCMVDGDRLAILSIQHQIVHIFEVTSRFRPLCKLGPFGSSLDDAQLLENAFPGSFPPPPQATTNQGPLPISTLKHRLLSYLYFTRLSQPGLPAVNLLKFHSQIDDVLQLRMFRMQLLDRDHVLMKLAPERVLLAMLGQAAAGNGSNIGASVSIDAASSGNSATAAAISAQLRSSSLLVIYSLPDDQVISVLQDGSDSTLDFVLTNADCILAHTASTFESRSEGSLSSFSPADASDVRPFASQAALRVPTNCEVARCIFAQHRRVNSRLAAATSGGGGRAEANCRAMAAFLFAPSQSHSPSPYVDYSLFAFDDRLLSPLLADAKPRQLTPTGAALRLFYPTTGHSACRLFVSCGPNCHPHNCPCQEFTSHTMPGNNGNNGSNDDPPSVSRPASQTFPFRTLVSTVIHPWLPLVLSYTRLVPTDPTIATTPMDLLNLHIPFSP